MQYVHQYKLRPTHQQAETMQRWLDMLRAQYNWMLAERFEWWQFNRNAANSCSLVQGPIQIRENPDYYLQKEGLVQLKQKRPWYKEVYSQILQEVVKQVKQAFDRYIKGDSNGKRSVLWTGDGSGSQRSNQSETKGVRAERTSSGNVWRLRRSHQRSPRSIRRMNVGSMSRQVFGQAANTRHR